MINNVPDQENCMTRCPQCGTRMNYNDETTKLTEYACPRCHATEIVKKQSYHSTA